jgi:hypothetical protein
VLGDVTVGEASNMAYTFQTEPTETDSGGIIEFSMGFVSGTTTTTQTINGVAWGDEFQFDGANFTKPLLISKRWRNHMGRQTEGVS